MSLGAQPQRLLHAVLPRCRGPLPTLTARLLPFPFAVIVKASSGPRYVVGVRTKVDQAKLTNGTRVSLDMTTLTIMRILPREVSHVMSPLRIHIWRCCCQKHPCILLTALPAAAAPFLPSPLSPLCEAGVGISRSQVKYTF